MFESIPTTTEAENNSEENDKQFETYLATVESEMIDEGAKAEEKISELINEYGETSSLRKLRNKLSFLRKLGVAALMAFALSTEDASGQEYSADFLDQYTEAVSVERGEVAEQANENELIAEYKELLMSGFASDMTDYENKVFTTLSQLDSSTADDTE